MVKEIKSLIRSIILIFGTTFVRGIYIEEMFYK